MEVAFIKWTGNEFQTEGPEYENSFHFDLKTFNTVQANSINTFRKPASISVLGSAALSICSCELRDSSENKFKKWQRIGTKSIFNIPTGVAMMYNRKSLNRTKPKNVYKESKRFCHKRCASPDMEDSRSAWMSMVSLIPVEVSSFNLQWQQASSYRTWRSSSSASDQKTSTHSLQNWKRITN